MVGKRGIREKIDKGKRGGGEGGQMEGRGRGDRTGEDWGGGRGLYVTCQITSRSPH